MRAMEIRQLRYFLDIARTEHLTQSAQNLFVTQSTLSHGLRQLEEDLGLVLFERVGRGLKLSKAGAEFRVYATRALKEIEAGRMALAELSGLQAGSVTVGAIPTFLNTVVPVATAAFSQAHPKVTVEVRELRAAPLEEQLLGAELDLGIAFHPTAHAELETEPLFDERMLLVVGPAHPWAARKQVAMKALAGLPLALLPRSFTTRKLIDEGLREAGVQPLVRAEVASVEALIAVCRHGDLASILPERAARLARDVTVMTLTAPVVVRHAGLLWRRGASRSTAAREFADRLRRAAGR
jgi:LysR family cyn operon transcriptional activator